MRKSEADLCVMEDLGRVVRGAEAVRLLGVGVDHGTRCISPNDCVDTIEPTWEEDALSACRDHVGHNAHTSRRLKQKLMNRFKKFGGAPAHPVAGYVVPPDAKTYHDWRRDDAATPVIAEGFRILGQTLNGEAAAEYFNAVPWNGGTGFPPGPYCRRRGSGGATVPASRWDGGKALRFYRNRILGGAPGRGHRHTIKLHESGRRISVPNPGGACYIDCPHLAHVDLAEQDALIARLKVRNANLGRKPVNGIDPLARSSRKDSRFPSGPARCWYCGRRCVWGANGVVGGLMCSGSREWACWNSIGFDGALATRAVLDRLSTVLHGLEGFDTQFLDLVRLARQGPCDLQQRRDKLRLDEARLALERENVQATIAKVGPKPTVLESLERVEAEEARLTAERRAIDALALRKLDVPESPAELRQRFEDQPEKLAVGSREFGRLLRGLVVEFDVYLVRLVDGGHLLPRARVKLSLDGIAPDARHIQCLSDLLVSEFTIDLFHPPQRELIRRRAVELVGTDEAAGHRRPVRRDPGGGTEGGGAGRGDAGARAGESVHARDRAAGRLRQTAAASEPQVQLQARGRVRAPAAVTGL